MRNKRVLVTGGAGFIGTNLCKQLARDNTVYSVDNYSTGNVKNHQKGVIYQKIDLANDDFTLDYKEYDVIFHLAAKARIQPSFDDPIDYLNNNCRSTWNIMEQANVNDIPIIIAGSSSHHGGKFKNPYTFSKDLSEDISTMFSKLYGTKTSIARFYNVYGPHELVQSEYATLIGKCKSSIISDTPFQLYGDGSKRRDFTHVNYIIDGLIKIYDNECWGETFEFGTGRNYSVKEVVELFGLTSIEYHDDKEGEMQETICNSSLAQSKLDWKAEDLLKVHIESFLEGLSYGVYIG